MTDHARRDREIRDGLFFVVGHHRGGTTLLQSMLTCHSRMTLPPETQFFLEVWPKQRRYGDLADPEARRRLVDFLQSIDCSVRDLRLRREDILEALPPSPSYADVLVTLLGLWGSARGKARVGEKSPGQIFRVPMMAELYPRAKFITILRDPRAVVNSEFLTPWGARSAHQVTRRWNRVVDEHEQLAQLVPRERYTMVQYEDLVTHPEETLKSVCAFLGEDFEPRMLKYYERPANELGFVSTERWKYNTLNPLDPERIAAWRQRLSPRQLAIIERTAGDRLERLGYARTRGERIGALTYAWSRFVDRVPWAVEVLTGAARRKRGPRRRRW